MTILTFATENVLSFVYKFYIFLIFCQELRPSAYDQILTPLSSYESVLSPS